MKKITSIDKFQSRQGVAAVEFALILPILLIVLFAIVELSVLLYDKAVITNAGREAARAGIISSSVSDADIQNYVNNYCNNRLITFGTTISLSTTVSRPQGSNSGNPLIVKIKYSYTGLVLGQLIQPTNWSQNLESITTMNYE